MFGRFFQAEKGMDAAIRPQRQTDYFTCRLTQGSGCQPCWSHRRTKLLLLPTTAESVVELHQRESFVQLCLCQR